MNVSATAGNKKAKRKSVKCGVGGAITPLFLSLAFFFKFYLGNSLTIFLNRISAERRGRDGRR